jgi:hypothetical protein
MFSGTGTALLTLCNRNGSLRKVETTFRSVAAALVIATNRSEKWKPLFGPLLQPFVIATDRSEKWKPLFGPLLNAKGAGLVL